jgi:tetratricopeptide (TPR) repeat protein
MKVLAVLLPGVLIPVFSAFSQTAPAPHQDHIPRDYRMTPMSATPHRLEGIGTSHLQITTQSAEAQAWFDQGLRLLHCFWDFEAHRAFQEAARLDPEAAMAWWGVAQSTGGYKAMEDETNAAAAKAQALLPKVSEHEQFYIRAQKEDLKKDGHDAWLAEMQNLIDKYPADVDAKLFLSLNMTYGYDTEGRPGKDSIYAQMLIQDVLHEHPDSAAANHYMIHALESSLHAEDAAPNADALARLATGSGHMIHMPGHIYYRAGQYDRARDSFLASKKFDEEYMQREKVGTVDDWNYAHNLSYLIASDAESGRYQEALELANLLDHLPASPFLGKGVPAHVITVGGTAVRLRMRFGDYQAAIDHPIKLGFDESLAGVAAIAFRDGMVAYAKGMQAVSQKNTDAAERFSDALDAISWRLSAGKPDNAKRALLILETVSLDLRGNLRTAQGRFDEGIDLLKKAVEKEATVGYNEPPQYARPELEALGYAYLRAGKYADARDAFTRELKLRPNSGHELYGIAQTYEAEGKRDAAAKAYAEFLEAWKSADSGLPTIQHARKYSNPVH